MAKRMRSPLNDPGSLPTSMPHAETTSGLQSEPEPGSSMPAAPAKKRRIRLRSLADGEPLQPVTKRGKAALERLKKTREKYFLRFGKESDTATGLSFQASHRSTGSNTIGRGIPTRTRPKANLRAQGQATPSHTFSDECCSQCNAGLDFAKGIWFLNKCKGALCHGCVNRDLGAMHKCGLHPMRKEQTVCQLRAQFCVCCANAKLPTSDLMLNVCGHLVCESCLEKHAIGKDYHCKACFPGMPDPNPTHKYLLLQRFLCHAHPES